MKMKTHDWFSTWASEEHSVLPAIGADGVYVAAKPLESSPTPTYLRSEFTG